MEIKTDNNNELPKTYESNIAEEKWYKIWEQGKYFKPRESTTGKSFSILMPPPNVTGQLHMGHALDITTQDALIRFHRMLGDKTIYLPGTDHAGIATQAVVEKLVWEKEKKTRHQIGRQDFVKKIWEWKEAFGNIINKQQKAIGASPDWDEFVFTMDPASNEAVNYAFVELYKKGLIYRGEYIINWDPELQSAISDAEVEHIETKGALYTVKYSIKGSNEEFHIATTRPETMFGDTAVCVHPDDERYKHLIGKMAIIPIANREIPIIADEHVDKEFGTGCLKVTPGHDFNDFEIGKRHKLPIINILNKDGTLNNHAGEFAGLPCKKARTLVTKKLDELGCLLGTKDHVHMVGHGDRSKVVIEPMVSKQWFLNVKDIAKRSYDAVVEDKTRFWPKQWENTFFSWMKEPKDWCISRQLWWGHRIPVFYCGSCGHEWASEKEIQASIRCEKCYSEKISQDEDVLDTWFSSGLWPLTTLGWPNQNRMDNKSYNNFFPGSVLVTGYDIIFFWVARMMMFSLHFTDKVPFHHVYVHAIVRDKMGRKMSKSLGNGIDPLEMIAKYGADALRFTLAAGSGYNRNLNLDPERIEGYRNFVNKVWNAFRFIQPHLEKASISFSEQGLDHHEKWILSEFSETVTEVNKSLNEYRFDDACAQIYSFVYDKYCSWFIELSKPILNSTDHSKSAQRASVLKNIFREMVKLMHPITPYITEEIWSYLKEEKEDLLIIQKYPTTRKWNWEQDRIQMNKFIETVTSIRYLRSTINLKPKDEAKIEVYTQDPNLSSYYKENSLNLFEMARVHLNKVDVDSVSTQKPQRAVTQSLGHSQVFLLIESMEIIEEQVNRLKKDLEKTKKEFEKYDKKLTNQQFMANAPEEVVAEVKFNHKDQLQKLASIEESIKQFTSK